MLEQFGEGQEKKKAKVPWKQVPMVHALTDGCAGSRAASSGADGDDMQNWLSCAAKETSNLQKSIDRSDEVLVVANANPANT